MKIIGNNKVTGNKTTVFHIMYKFTIIKIFVTLRYIFSILKTCKSTNIYLYSITIVNNSLELKIYRTCLVTFQFIVL